MILSLFAIAGCNIIGAVASKVPQKIPAQYIPKPDPMVVVAENWRNPDGASTDSEQLARFISADLGEHKVAPQIDPIAVLDLKSQRGGEFRSMTVAQIGKYLGAQQVLYVNITQVAIDGAAGTDARRAKCTARVKVIDTETGALRWPEDQTQGFPVTIQTPMVELHTDADEISLRETLQRAAAARIARLFYETAVEE